MVAIGSVGASPAPPGVIPNFENPKDVLRTINFVTGGLAIGLTTLFVFGRLYVRLWVARAVLIEDWFCLAAWIFNTVFCATSIHTSSYGAGYHEWEVSPQDLVGFRKTEYVLAIVYGPAIFCIKMTLLLILVRIFTPFRTTINAIWGFIVFLFLYYAVVMALKILECNPIASVWDPNVPGTCLNEPLLFKIDSALSVFTDAVILILPILLVSPLQVSIKKKLRTIALLSAGGVGTATSVVRMILVVRLDGSLYGLGDQTVSVTRLNLLCIAELAIGLICACLPAFNIYFNKFLEERKTRSTNTDDSTKLGHVTRLRYGVGVEPTRKSSYVEIETPHDFGALISNPPDNTKFTH
ncbi:hypothetical protein LZ554_007800 [Drepanopeziza brunnea f. sp. 'monogermtubi']|nr:hypothetical protein LZ554_007800 [Drepanopeziza brunnea f. sp. 'monogermtubi']